MTDDIPAIHVFVVGVVMLRSEREQRSVVLLTHPSHLIDIQAVEAHVQDFELMELGPGIEDQVSSMVPLHTSGVLYVRRQIHHRRVPASVLHHHGFQLARRIHDATAAIADSIGKLLMTLLEINIRVSEHLTRDIHHGLA